ncbi:unnamed protein product [Cyclocybe aegerita]|uniref:Uncharacterized protein n=1 Tax=Cyclocybe aegerita TaxID=1973307 RepID=A0A8S0VT27_CYCAE|nr:unnamed protein product [Cyclocybe aegerita]
MLTVGDGRLARRADSDNAPLRLPTELTTMIFEINRHSATGLLRPQWQLPASLRLLPSQLPMAVIPASIGREEDRTPPLLNQDQTRLERRPPDEQHLGPHPGEPRGQCLSLTSSEKDLPFSVSGAIVIIVVVLPMSGQSAGMRSRQPSSLMPPVLANFSNPQPAASSQQAALDGPSVEHDRGHVRTAGRNAGEASTPALGGNTKFTSVMSTVGTTDACHGPPPVAGSQCSTPPFPQHQHHQHHQQQHQQQLQVDHGVSAVVPYPPCPMPEVVTNLQQRISAYEDARARIASAERLAQAARAAGHRLLTDTCPPPENALPLRSSIPTSSSFVEFRVNVGGATNFDISTPATEAERCRAVRAKAQKEAQKEAQKDAKKKDPEEGPEEGIRSSPVVREVAEETQRLVPGVVVKRSRNRTDSPPPTEPYRPSEKALGKRKAVEILAEVDGVEFLDGDLPDDAEESTECQPVFKADEQCAKETPSSKPYPECNCTGVEHEVSCILDTVFASLSDPPTTTSTDAVEAGSTVGVVDFPELNYLAEGQDEPLDSSAHLEGFSFAEDPFGFELWPLS